MPAKPGQNEGLITRRMRHFFLPWPNRSPTSSPMPASRANCARFLATPPLRAGWRSIAATGRCNFYLPGKSSPANTWCRVRCRARRPIRRYNAMSFTNRQFGNPLHPENTLPAFRPDFTFRCTSALPHFGQVVVLEKRSFRSATCSRRVAHVLGSMPVLMARMISSI